MRSYWWLVMLFVLALGVTEFASDALYARATWGKAIDENEFTASPTAMESPANLAHPATNKVNGHG